MNQPTNIFQTITAHYLLFVFLACLGVLQFAGVRTGARRLLLLRDRRASAALGVLLLIGAYVFFFTQATYYEPGLEGAQLFFEFGGAALAALLVCVGVNLERSGQLGSALSRLRLRVRASARELRPLIPGGRRMRREA